jgi:pimeloyl-ACP methyl ester carboxylesterase
VTSPSRRLLSAALLLVGVLLAACSGSVSGTASIGPAGTSAATTPTSTEIGPVPAGLQAFYGQQLDWGSCADLAVNDDTKFYRSPVLQCADLTVPLSYDNPAGPTITLKVLRKPATDPANRIGSVVTDPGGPGASGVENAGTIGAYGLAKDLNARFDLVGFDPRGVGASVPQIRCQTDAERDATRATTVRTRTQQEIDAADALAQQLAQGCAALSVGQGVDGAAFLAGVGTSNVAKDMDVLRAVLGDRQLTYIGWSYGTAIGTSYAEQFPQNVRALILDGAVDPNEDAAASNIGQAEGFQQAFDDFAAWCAQQQQCALGKDPANATATYQALVRPLLDRPLPLADGRVITFNDATTGTFTALYGESLWQSLSKALTGLSQGDGSALMALADSYLGRDAQGHYTNVQDAFLAVSCIDGSRTVDPATAQQLAEKYAAAAPFMASGDPPAAIKDPCDFWPVPPATPQPVGGVAGLPRVLVISTTKDPATPYQDGVNLAKTLDAALLTVDGTNHTAYLGTGNQCVDQIGNDYLINVTLPDDGTTC